MKTSADLSARLPNNNLRIYDYTISDVIKESWDRVKGSKATYWGAILIYILACAIVIGMGLFVLHFFTKDPKTINMWAHILSNITSLVFLPLVTGIFYLGVRRAVDLPIKSKSILYFYGFYWRLLGVTLLSCLVFTIVFGVGTFLAFMFHHLLLSLLGPLLALLLLILVNAIAIWFSLYLLTALCFAPLLIIEKNMGTILAMKTSLRGFYQHGSKNLFLMLVVFLIVTLFGVITLGITYIWTWPMMLNLWGILYRMMFGVEATTV